ncbi:hypothetical protein [Aquipuribacter hungaricus]|uniref:hypothetical protein n=1 Tax=Aquipuribacter hungaricus TaxID=545624 RepID=UPI00360D4D42
MPAGDRCDPEVWAPGGAGRAEEATLRFLVVALTVALEDRGADRPAVRLAAEVTERWPAHGPTSPARV